MATMHGIGEAAGAAASVAVNNKMPVTEVSGATIRALQEYMQRPPDFGKPWDAKSGFPWTSMNH
jgi:hypothetical protein